MFHFRLLHYFTNGAAAAKLLFNLVSATILTCSCIRRRTMTTYSNQNQRRSYNNLKRGQQARSKIQQSENVDRSMNEFNLRVSFSQSVSQSVVSQNLELRICTPTEEIALTLRGTGQPLRACGGEGGTFSDLMVGKAGCLKRLNVSLDTTS